VNSRKVLAGLDEMKADYHQNFIDYFAGGHKAESFTEINPHATVPAATDGDLTITESVSTYKMFNCQSRNLLMRIR
jgi:glutathione S-transferase